MIALVSKQDELGRNKWVCNSADVSETDTGNVTYATITVSGAKHGDEMTCIETEKKYLYDATTSKWARKKDA